MDMTQILMAITMIAYLVIVIVVGFRYSNENNDVSDFYLGGRKLGPFVTAMSAEASDMSSYLLMGLPGVAYLSGCADVGWTVIGLAIGTYLNWLLVAKRLRIYSHKVNAITIPDFFKNRFRDETNLLLGISALVIIIFFIPYTGSGFAACGKLFHTLFGVDYHVAMIACAIVIVIYTTLGGFLAASTTDFIQSIVMTIALLIVVGFGIWAVGGWNQVIAVTQDLPGYLSMVKTYDPTTGTGSTYGVITTISTLAWGLGYFGMPHILLRFMAIEDKEKLTLSRRIASVWVVISMAVAVVIGIVGYTMSATGLVDTLEGSDSETIIVQIANVISKYGWFAAIIGGVILAGILASTMSTADSQLLAASSSFSQNLCQSVFGIKMSKLQALIAARASVVGIALIGIVIAWNPDSSVFSIVSFAWAGFGAAFGPVMLCALFWKRTNFPGALAGMVAGGVMVFVWKFLVRPIGGAWNIYELLPAFIVGLVAIVVVSLLTKAPTDEMIEEFEAVRAERATFSKR